MDRLTKTLLALIAAALWGLLLRPLLAPGPDGAALARPAVSPAPASVAGAGQYIYVAQGGHLYCYFQNLGTGRLEFQSVRGINTSP